MRCVALPTSIPTPTPISTSILASPPAPRCGATTLLVCLSFAACIDQPPLPPDAAARLVVAWDPAPCGPPHRVAVELADEAGARLSSSATCASGSIALDAPHFGVYIGRVYAWTAGEPIRSITPLHLAIDEPLVRWLVATPL